MSTQYPISVLFNPVSVTENRKGALFGTLFANGADGSLSPTFTVSDDRFVIVGNELRLSPTFACDFEAMPLVTVDVTVASPGCVTATQPIAFQVTNVNEAPTSIALTSVPVPENSPGAFVGTLTGMDSDVGDSLTFSTADTRFKVVGNQLWLRPGVALDFERTPSTNVKIKATDTKGASLIGSVAVTARDVNEAPTTVNLSSSIIHSLDRGAVVGTLTTVDPDRGDHHRYKVSDTRFEVVNNQLRLKDSVAIDYDIAKSIPITVTATDDGGLRKAQSFTLSVTGVVVEDRQRIAYGEQNGLATHTEWTETIAGSGTNDSVILERYARGGSGGPGTSPPPETIAGGGIGGAGGFASASVHDAVFHLGAARTAPDKVELTVRADGGLGGDGGFGGSRLGGTIAGPGGAGGAGGSAHSSLSTVSVETVGRLDLKVNVTAMGATGGYGGGGGWIWRASDDRAAGGSGGAGGSAVAEIQGVRVASGLASSVTANVSAWGADGQEGFDPMHRGAGGYGIARLAESEFRLGSAADTLSLVAVANRGAGETLEQDGKARIEIVGNHVSLGAGNDVLRIGANIVQSSYRTDLYEALDGNAGNFVFEGNVFDGGAGKDIVDLTLLQRAGVTVDLVSEMLFIAGSPGNSLSGFEVFRGTGNSDVFIDGAGNQTYFGNSGSDQFIFRPGHGTDTIHWDPHDLIDLRDFGPALDSYADVAPLLSATGGMVRLATPDGGNLLLSGTSIAGLTAEHFRFGP